MTETDHTSGTAEAGAAAGEMTPVKRALLEIRSLRDQIKELESAAKEPIAVVGVGCRLPGGVDGPDGLWSVLRDGVDTIGEVPAERWDIDRLYNPDPEVPGTMWTRSGGFIDEADTFDAAFFGIAPLEAVSMDPQQRIMLEVAWEALERAQISPDSLTGSNTGVFMGVGNVDYGRRLFREADRISAYAGTGMSQSAVAGRLSYQLGLRGPSMAVDTACSASLVAVHLACQSLRRGESDLALAGGVNLMLGPEAHMAFTRAKMMAPDGRCKTFAESADGYGRGEGAGVIVLRRLSDAQADGDNIMAIVAGSAINQDGRSAGLTVPNGPSQVDVLRAALAEADLEPSDIDYVEAHGTGTPLGDPIELQAIAEALGTGRESTDPVLVGSCKTNFGHLEAAAGIAGLLKVIVSLQHRTVPQNLHFDEPNSRLDWDALPLRVPTSTQPWPDRAGPGRAGVSSFGFTGTNAHVIVEQAPANGAETAPAPQDEEPEAHTTESSTDPRPRHVFVLSAADDEGLRQLAERHLESIAASPAVDLADLCWSAATTRAHLGVRLAVSCSDLDELISGLTSYRDASPGDPNPAGNVRVGWPKGAAKPVVGFTFTGQGARYTGVGQDLYNTNPVFRTAIDDCDRAFGPLLDRALLDILYPGEHVEPEPEDAPPPTEYAQPAMFAIEYALAKLWRSWGVEPGVVFGHSLGEIAAACVAGVFGLEDGARIVTARSSLMSRTAPGAMASVNHPTAAVDAIIAASEAEVASYNGPTSVVVSGPVEAVDAVCTQVEEAGGRYTPLLVDRAFHSKAMEPVLDQFVERIGDVRFEAPHLPVMSNVTGRAASTELADPGYWANHIRQSVQFESCVRAAAELGVTHVVEVGPAPLVLGMVSGVSVVPVDNLLPSLRPSASDWRTLLETLQTLYVSGVDVDWEAFDQHRRPQRVPLPTYPFQRRRFWFDLNDETSSSEDPEHTWRSIAGAVERNAELGPIDADVTGYDKKWASLERLTVAAAGDTLAESKIFTTADDRATVAQVRDRLGASDQYDHLLGRWLERLVDGGILRLDGDTFVTESPLTGNRVPEHLAEAEQQLAGDPYLMDYIRHCANLLPAVIRGEESPLMTLFPNGSFAMAEGIYQRSVGARYVNQLAASLVHALVAASPNRPLRILEIGAGTGGTTASLLPLLPPDRTEYWFTDVSDLFLERARLTFGHYPFVRFGLFDLEADPAAQGLETGSFDLVFAANAVHATTDLRKSLETIHDLLAPAGVLALVESTDHLAWFDMTTGLIEGWQAFADDLRVDNPLLPAPTWLDALKVAGFARTDAWPKPGSATESIAQHLVAAQKEGVAVASAVTITGDIGQDPGHTAAFEAGPSTVWLDKLDEVPKAERVEVIEDLVREQVMTILGLSQDQSPAATDGLLDLGFDSLMAVNLSGRISHLLALAEELPSTLVFDHPSIRAIATHVVAIVDGQAVDGSGDGAVDSAPDNAAEQPTPSTEQDDGLVADVAAMSDAEIEAQLRSRFDNS